jgi:hypothetical protein
MFISTCHHYSRVGHIQPQCYKLKTKEPKRENIHQRNDLKGLFNMTMDVVSSLDKLKDHKAIPRGRRNKDRKGEITHPLRGSGKRPLPRLGGYFVCLGLEFMNTYAS